MEAEGPVRQLRFRAMGSDAHVIVVGGPPGLPGRARHRIAQLEGRWSRFRPDSEICELARRAGSPMVVTADTIELVRRAVEAWRLTGASFDPTVLGSVIEAGYDRSFEELPTYRPVPDRAGPPPRHRSPLVVGCSDIEIVGPTVRLPAGTGFDPGGIGKGLAADIVTRELLDAGADGVCVNLGGDVRVAGTGPGADGWTITIEAPGSRAELVRLGLADGAVATSTTVRRAWEVGGERRHHVIDPATGRPSTTDLVQATAVAAEGWMAEVLATAVLLRGAAHPFDLIDGSGVEALVVDAAGRVTASPGLARFTGGEAGRLAGVGAAPGEGPHGSQR